MRGFTCLSAGAILLAALQCAVPFALAQVGQSPASAPSTQADPQPKDGPRITVAPAAITFPDLAKKLSAPGRKVICPRAFSQRAAVVCLKNRTWSDTRAVLEHALELKIVETSPGEWTFRPDQAIVRRDRKRLDILCEMLRKKLVEQVVPASGIPILTAASYSAMARRYQSLALEELSRLQTDPKFKEPSSMARLTEMEELGHVVQPFRWAALSVVSRLTSRDIVAAIRGASGFVRNPTLGLINPQDTLSVERSDFDLLIAVTRDLAAQGFRSAVEDVKEMEASPPKLKLYTDAYSRLFCSPSDLTIHLDCLTVTRDAVDLARGSEIRLDVDDVLDQVRTSERKASEFSASPSSLVPATDWKKPIPIHRRLSTTSLSQVVESWCDMTGREAIIELFATRERVDLPYHTVTNDETGVTTPVARTTTLQAVMDRMKAKSVYVDEDETRMGWETAHKHGVLAFTNPLAFIDRQREMPIPTMLKLESRWTGKPSEEGLQPAPLLQDILAFQRATTPHQSAVAYDADTYRGVPYYDVCEARPHLLLIASLGEGRVNQLESELKRGPVRIRLLDLSPASRDAALVALRNLMLLGSMSGDARALLPGYEPIFARKVLVLSAAEEDGMRTVTMSISDGIKVDDDDQAFTAKLEGLRFR